MLDHLERIYGKIRAAVSGRPAKRKNKDSSSSSRLRYPPTGGGLLMTRKSTYPPELEDEQLENLAAQVFDYQLSHGSLLKLGPQQGLDPPVTGARTIGVSVFPTPFPRQLFEQACEIQPLFDELYIRASEDRAYLDQILAEIRETDEFVAKLVGIWYQTRDGPGQQPIRCGVWRSDYMLQGPDPAMEGSRAGKEIQDEISDLPGMLHSQLKQVEFNTYSCAGGTHGNIVADMHRYIASRGGHGSDLVTPESIPQNTTIKGIMGLIERAHRLYCSEPLRADGATPGDDSITIGDPRRPRAVLMTVQPRNINTCDERPIEYALWDSDPPIPLFRVVFPDEILEKCTLGLNGELLFRPSSHQGNEPVEISLVYQRAGYDAEEYTPNGVAARLLLERSRAIKCPTIAGHLVGLKKVQQELCAPGALERFLKPGEAEVLRRTFVDMFPMDPSVRGLAAREKAKNKELAAGYILKPSLEGGGHNIHGAEIPDYLKKLPQDTWNKYILMQRICPPLLNNLLISHLDIHDGSVVSELGIFGTCVWRVADGGHQAGAQGLEILGNEQSGWSFKTKASYVDEMSVVKGFGCFDCPCLIDAA